MKGKVSKQLLEGEPAAVTNVDDSQAGIRHSEAGADKGISDRGCGGRFVSLESLLASRTDKDGGLKTGRQTAPAGIVP